MRSLLFDDNYLSALATIRIPGCFLDSVGEGETEGGSADWSFPLPHRIFLCCLPPSLVGNGRLRLFGRFQAITRKIDLQNDAVMNQAIDRRGGRERVLEDALPF